MLNTSRLYMFNHWLVTWTVTSVWFHPIPSVVIYWWIARWNIKKTSNKHQILYRFLPVTVAHLSLPKFWMLFSSMSLESMFDDIIIVNSCAMFNYWSGFPIFLNIEQIVTPTFNPPKNGEYHNLRNNHLECIEPMKITI